MSRTIPSASRGTWTSRTEKRRKQNIPIPEKIRPRPERFRPGFSAEKPLNGSWFPMRHISPPPAGRYAGMAFRERKKTRLRKKVEIIDAFIDSRSGILTGENGKIVRKSAKKHGKFLYLSGTCAILQFVKLGLKHAVSVPNPKCFHYDILIKGRVEK